MLLNARSKFFKNHLKACLASLDPDFPIRKWDRLLPQEELTLNLLRASRLNPKMSAYAYMYWNFDYNRTPLVPPGTRFVSHIKSGIQRLWEFNGEQGWTVSSPDHYICITCYFLTNRQERQFDSVTFILKTVSYPSVKMEDYLAQAAEDIIYMLTAPEKPCSVSLEDGDATRNSLLKLSTFLRRKQELPEIKIKEGESRGVKGATVPRVLGGKAAPPRVNNIPPPVNKIPKKNTT